MNPGAEKTPDAAEARDKGIERLLSLRSVGHVFRDEGGGEVRALAGIELAVHRGDVLGIVGENGAGKTTLARIIAGLLAPSEGSVAYEGEPRVGLVFQEPERQLFARTGFEELAFGLNVEPSDLPEDAIQTARSLGLTEEMLAASPFSLAPGQKRLLALASFLVLDCDILIADEPLSGLAPGEAAATARSLIAAGEKTGALVVIAHDLTHLFWDLSRVVLLDGGEIIWSGDPKELLEPGENPLDVVVELPEAVRLARLLYDIFPEADLTAKSEEGLTRKIAGLLKEA